MRIRPVSRLLSAALLCAALAACSFDERIADHAIKYNKTVEEANNSLLLLNILRARDRRPMHFTALSQVRGSLTLSSTGSLGLEIPFLGDAVTTFPLSPSLSLTRTSSPSFDVAILDTKEFMSGILSPIEKSLFEFYWHQRWPPEVLLHLFIHKVDITYDPWEKNTKYKAEAKILESDLIWVTSASGTSAGEPNWGSKPGHEVKDDNITWKALYKADPWAANTFYRAGTTILANGLIWKSSKDGTSGTVINEPTWVKIPGGVTDKGITWTAQSIIIDPWTPSKSYASGDTILENGLIWTTASGGMSRKGEPKWVKKPQPGFSAQDNGFKWKAMTAKQQKMEQKPLVNAPKSDQINEFEKFQNWINTIDVKELDFGTSKTGRPIGAELKLDDQAVLEHLVEAEKAELRLVGIPEDKPTHYRLCKITTSVILCAGKCPKSNPEGDCRDGTDKEPATPGDLAVKVEGKRDQTVHLRSVQGILFYLGQILKYQEKEKPIEIGQKPKEKRILFHLVSKKEDADTPIIGVEYDNQWYYVPKGDEGKRTKTVLALVLQLLGLHKESKELPTTTAVETVGGSP